MKKILSFVFLVFTIVVSCDKFDDSAIWEKLYNHESRIANLEELCKQMNTNISSLQSIVGALQNNDYVTAVVPVTKNNETIGYTISFTKLQPITIYHGENGKDGKDGENGKDGMNGNNGKTPIIGVKLDTDGIYYWTLNGEWLLNDSGQKIRVQGIDGKDGINGENGQNGKDGVDGSDGKDGEQGLPGSDGKDGITPQLKIENDYWYVSYDNGQTWEQLYKAVGEDGRDGSDGTDGKDGEQGIPGTDGTDGKDGKDGDSFFQSVDATNQYYIVITLADGTVIKLPTWKAHQDLEAIVSQMNNNISALQKLVEALESKDYVTSTTPLVENGVIVGYIINFTKSGPITIMHGKDGVNGSDGASGKDGKDGVSPVIGVKQDKDGRYYWTLNGIWLLDSNGNKIPTTGNDGKDGQDGKDGINGENGKDGEQGAPGTDGKDGEQGVPGEDGIDGIDGKDGITPRLKIENDYWYVSYDNGQTWEQLYKAVGEDGADGTNGEQGVPGVDGKDGIDGKDGDSFFQDVDATNQYYVIITLADGTAIKLPKVQDSNVLISVGETSLNSVTFVGSINRKTVDLKVTIYYGEEDTIDIYNAKKVSRTDFSSGKDFSIVIEKLKPDTIYYYFIEVVSNGSVNYSEIKTFQTDHFDETNDTPIVFEDAIVEMVCLSKYDTNGNGVLSMSEVASIERIENNFFGNYAQAVTSFNELKYFTSLKSTGNGGSIDGQAFYNCVNLKSITLPDNLKKIGDAEFYNCQKLESIIIPDGVTYIGSDAFEKCRSLKEIIIPDSVTSRLTSTFIDCTKLSSVKIGNGVKELSWTFDGCNALSKIQFGTGIERILGKSFDDSRITDVIVSDLSAWLKVEIEQLASSPTWLNDNLWEGDKLVKQCVIPSDAVSVGYNLSGCGSVEEVIIPDGVLFIGNQAFWGCGNLRKVKIGNDVASIGSAVFSQCPMLSCFEGKFISEDGKCVIVDNELRGLAVNGLTEYTIPSGVKTIDSDAFTAKNTLERLIIGNDVETIEAKAFFGSGIKEVVITDNVKYIGNNAFGWSEMETVYCNMITPPTAEIIGSYWEAFYNTNLTTIYVPTESLDLYLESDGWKEYASCIKPYDFVE